MFKHIFEITIFFVINSFAISKKTSINQIIKVLRSIKWKLEKDYAAKWNNKKITYQTVMASEEKWKIIHPSRNVRTYIQNIDIYLYVCTYVQNNIPLLVAPLWMNMGEILLIIKRLV